MVFSFVGIAFTISASAIFAAGGFYLLTNFRLTRLEELPKSFQEIRERLIRIETKIETKIENKEHK
jgi:hypothetical protein